MATLPPKQIGALIVEVGAFGISMGDRAAATRQLDVAIAVCLAESGGNTRAHNPSGASGLWQIMAGVHKELIASQVAIYGLKKKTGVDVYDPHVNTACAATLYNQRQWQPWVAYTSGAYRKHTGHGAEAYTYVAKRAIAAGAPTLSIGGRKQVDPSWWTKAGKGAVELATGVAGLPGDAADKADEALDSIPKAIGYAVKASTGFLKDAGIAIGVFVLGLIILILGVWFIVSQSQSGRKAVGAATRGIVS